MTRTKSQKHGSQGQKLLAHLIEKHTDWLCREQPAEDYGIDVEAELSDPNPAGQFLKLQSKASASLQPTKNSVSCRVDRKFILYVDSCRIPVVLVALNLATEQAWYIWVQEWIYHYKSSGKSLDCLASTFLISIPIGNSLKSGLDGPLKDVASWKTSIQMVAGLLDSAKAAIASESPEVIEAILSALNLVHKQTPEFSIGYVMNEVLRLGGRIWASLEGNRMSQVLFAICREHGENFTAEQIRRLVVRENAYSRTGINALGILYEHFPDHTASLNLPKIFAKDDPRIAYFCKLRERNKGSNAFAIARAKGNFLFDGWTVMEGAEDRLFDKIANRGDSALLDYVISKEQVLRYANTKRHDIHGSCGNCQ
jgi:hypothetical protein